jgi:hypothetical protein
VDTKKPRYSRPHFSLTATALPVRSCKNGFGFTGVTWFKINVNYKVMIEKWVDKYRCHRFWLGARAYFIPPPFLLSCTIPEQFYQTISSLKMESGRTFMTLGMFILDRFEYLDDQGQPTGRKTEEQVCQRDQRQ